MVESYRVKGKKYPQSRIIRNFGSVSKEEADRLKIAFSPALPVEAIRRVGEIDFGETVPIGDVYLLHKIWEKWELGKVIDKYTPRQFKVSPGKMIKMMVINFLNEPS
jgi:hypothetical protein